MPLSVLLLEIEKQGYKHLYRHVVMFRVGCIHIVMAYIVIAYTVMAYVIMAYMVMVYDLYSCGLYSYGRMHRPLSTKEQVYAYA